MAKYQRTEIDEDELTYSEEFAAEQDATETQQLPPEEKTFKQRYGEIRQYMAVKDKEYQTSLANMQEQLDSATKKQIRFPKTDEEIDEWSEKYPDVSKIIDTIAQKRAREAMEEGEKKLSSLRSLETRLTKQTAEQQLNQLHPDFNDIRQDPNFHDWVKVQPQSIQDSLYKNTQDAHSAARSLDLYKSDMGIRKAKKSSTRSAAQSVGRTTNSAPPTGGKQSFSESQIAAMSDKEFEKHEEAILEAQRKGAISFDLSGGAR